MFWKLYNILNNGVSIGYFLRKKLSYHSKFVKVNDMKLLGLKNFASIVKIRLLLPV